MIIQKIINIDSQLVSELSKKCAHPLEMLKKLFFLITDNNDDKTSHKRLLEKFKTLGTEIYFSQVTYFIHFLRKKLCHYFMSMKISKKKILKCHWRPKIFLWAKSKSWDGYRKQQEPFQAHNFIFLTRWKFNYFAE